jgi:hypothetical protein
MLLSHSLFQKKCSAALRYWLGWLLLLVALAAAMHGYLDYRNCELDKRIERLKTSCR